MTDLSDDERRAGWTAEALARYRQERELAGLRLVSGIGPDGKPLKQPVTAENAAGFDPLNW